MPFDVPFDTTVLIPTYNEAGNVPALVAALRQAFAGRSCEILFVDDSDDATPDVVRALPDGDIPVRLVHRTPDQRVGGLSGAVTTGLAVARGDVVVVMDGDLQHPPAVAPQLRDAIAARGVDVAVASRYCADGDAEGLANGWRRTVSSASTLLARTLFPRRVGSRCTDPMTGFFAVRRDAVHTDRLRPRGFKILLEILVSHDLRVAELPFVFGERLSGESKASWRNGMHFLHQLLSLRVPQAVRFAAVGALGFVVNLVAMALLLHVGTPYVAASIVATELAIVHNFVLQERFVFGATVRDGSTRHSLLHRFWRCFLANNLDNAVRVPLLILLVERAGMHSLPAQALTLAVSFGARFAYTSRVVYRPALAAAAAARPALPLVEQVGAASPVPEKLPADLLGEGVRA